MNRAIKGNQQEIKYTQSLNLKNRFWDVLPYDINTTFAIHVNSNKYGKINESKIPPKADIFFATGFIDNNYLINNNYYLNEKDLVKFNLKPLEKSGVSVKLPNSRYTITKISPNTFYKIFKDNILGAGASIYCKLERELWKNPDVLNGWGVTESFFKSFFIRKLNLPDIVLNDLSTLKRIKKISNEEISRIIESDKVISDLIFKGIGNFEEPFTAHWIIENDILKPNYYIPFLITTGSGRSKGIFTVVLKPK